MYLKYCYKVRQVALAVLLVIIPFSGSTQLPTHEVLFSEYPKATLDSSSIKEKIAYAQKETVNNPDTALILLHQAYRESEQIQFYNGVILSLHAIGHIYQNRGNYDTALFYFKQVIDKGKELGVTRLLHVAYINIGSSYFYQSQYQKALNYYYNALEFIQEYHSHASTLDSFGIYINIALVWGRLGNTKEAVANLKIAEKIAQNSGNKEILGYYYGYAGSIYQHDRQSAIQYFHKSLRLKEKQKSPETQLSTLNSLAHIYIDLQMPDSAAFYINKAQTLIKKSPEVRHYDRLHTLDNLGHLYLLQKRYTEAKAVLLRVYKEAQQTGATDIIIHITPHLAETFVATKEFDQAYKYILGYAQLKDTVFEKQKTQSLNDWLELRNKEKDRTVQEQQLRISLQNSQLQSRNLWIATSLSCLLLSAIIFTMLYRNYKQKNRLQSATIKNLEQEQEIIKLKALVQGEEKERKRIAMELHDGIASELWAIKMNVATMKSQTHVNNIQYHDLEAIHEQLVNAAREIRSTAHNLIPDLLENGLSEALGALCKRISYQTKLEIDFQQYGNIPRLDNDIELSLYRMIQELINNCLKHADGATYLLVQISCTEHLLNITVEDNGTGFSNNEELIVKDQSNILHTVQQRVHTLKGIIDIQSIEGKGSTIYLEFDIHNLV